MIIVNYVGSEPQRERSDSQLTGLTGLANLQGSKAHLIDPRGIAPLSTLLYPTSLFVHLRKGRIE